MNKIEILSYLKTVHKIATASGTFQQGYNTYQTGVKSLIASLEATQSSKDDQVIDLLKEISNKLGK